MVYILDLGSKEIVRSYVSAVFWTNHAIVYRHWFLVR